MIECPHREPIEGQQFAHCNLLPQVHNDCPQGFVAESACQHCLTSPQAQEYVLKTVADRFRQTGYFYGQTPARLALETACPPPSERHPPNRIRWVSVVVTAPRPGGVTYLPFTVRSIVNAGFPHPYIFAEPGSPIPPEFENNTTTWKRPTGIFQNSLLAMNWIWQSVFARQWDAALVCEDDVELERGLRQYLDDHVLWPSPAAQLGFLSLYTADQPGVSDGPAGWHKFNRILWGAQSVVMSNEAMGEFLYSQHQIQRRRRPTPKPDEMPYMDMELSRWAMSRGRPMWHARTHGGGSLVKHRGVISTIPKRSSLKKGQGHRPDKWVATLAAERLKVCEECEHWNHDSVIGKERCFRCACKSPRTAETLGIADSCPDGKWRR